MDISSRDMKILWGRSGGICAFPGCGLELTPDPAGSGTPAVIGEMAHIVDKDRNGPRGNSPLTEAQRNSYANLILVCPTHHALIDDKDQAAHYPVELLHEWKSQHEDWVQYNRASNEADNWQDEHYAYLVDKVTEILKLGQWNRLSELLVTDKIPIDLSLNQTNLNALFLGAVWPATRPRLEAAIRQTVDTFNAYIEHFVEGASTDISGNFLVADHSYYQTSQGDIRKLVEAEYKENAWSKRNGELLCEFVAALNAFADIVREELNPRYLLENGRFLLIDSLGYRGGTSQVILLSQTKLTGKVGGKPTKVQSRTSGSSPVKPAKKQKTK
jgi:hypothetical protein